MSMRNSSAPTSAAASISTTSGRHRSRVRLAVSRAIRLSCGIWLIFVIAHSLLSGRWGLWVVPAMVPPLTFLLVPLAVGFGAVANRQLTSAFVAIVGLVLGWSYSGVNVAAFRSERSAEPTDLRVVSFNTEFFGSDAAGTMGAVAGRAALISYLVSLDADVYLLQEHMHRRDDGRAVPITDDISLLHSEFPGYEVVEAGELLTLSRVPVLGHRTVEAVDAPDLSNPPAPYVLRTDIDVGGSVLATYNVHMPVQLILERTPLGAEFYTEISSRADRRAREFDALTDSVVALDAPTLIAGDFNTSPAMRDLDKLRDVTTDAVARSRTAYPTSWTLGSILPALWRLDWALTKGDIDVTSFVFEDSHGVSDHKAQIIGVSTRGK